MVEDSLLSFLTTTPALSILINERVYLAARPQNERRASLVLTRISKKKFPTMEGTGPTQLGVIQVDCLGPTYGDAKVLAKAVSDTLEGFSGTLSGTKFHWINITDESDIPTVPLEGKAQPTFGVSLDVRFLATEQQ